MVSELFCVFDSVFESAVFDVPSVVAVIPAGDCGGGGEPFAGVSLGVVGGGCVCAVGLGWLAVALETAPWRWRLPAVNRILCQETAGV